MSLVDYSALESEIENALKYDFIRERVKKVEQYRKSSTREATKVLAKVPYRFGEVRHIESDSIVVPATSSEKREYIPIGFLNADVVISNHIVQCASLGASIC